MKRGVKVVVAGVVIAVFGVLVLICALGAAGWSFDELNDWQEEIFSTESNITKLQIEANVGDVVINRNYANRSVIVEYQYNDKYQPIIEEENGVLSIKTGEMNWYEPQFWFANAPKIEIIVNRETYPLIYLELNAGVVEFCDGEYGALIDVELNAGAVMFNDVTVDQLNIEVNAGAFKADKIVSQYVNCHVNAGALSATEVHCTRFYCEVNAGAVDMKKVDSSAIGFIVEAGTVNVGLVDSKQAYNITVTKRAGECNVFSQWNDSATHSLTIEVYAGSVNVVFNKKT